MARKKKGEAAKRRTGAGLAVAKHLFEGKRVIRDKADRTKPRNEDIGKGSVSFVVPAPQMPRAVDIYGN